MLGKVMKYDFKRLGKILMPLYLITLIMAGVNYGFQLLSEINYIFSIPTGLIMFAFILLLMGVVIGTFVITIKYFCTNLLGDEGYLTNTLPVSKNVLVSSKVIVSMIYGAISILILFLGIWIGFLNQFNFIQIIADVYNSGIFKIMSGLSSNFGGLCLLSGLMAITYLGQWLFFVFAIALGQTKSGNRVLYSFVYGILLYCVQQAVSFLMLGVLVLFDPKFFTATNPSSEAMVLLYGMSIFINVLMFIVFWVGTIKIFNKKLNLE